MIFGKLSLAALAIATAFAADGELWHFDNLTKIGGHTVTLVGDPHLIATAQGKAVEFNGVGDAIFLDVHPLAAAQTWTWEAIFRPDVGGNPEQRFFHLQENGTDSRMLMEIRIIDGKWCLDSFGKSGPDQTFLLDKTKLYPLGAWYNITTVYDGHEFRNYVNGELQGTSQAYLGPQSAGACSIGVRYNKRDFFKGAVSAARMTPRALQPSEFMTVRKPAN